MVPCRLLRWRQIVTSVGYWPRFSMPSLTPTALANAGEVSASTSAWIEGPHSFSLYGKNPAPEYFGKSRSSSARACSGSCPCAIMNGNEIGRASCRERGEISVVGGAVKEKKKKK